jgi:phosphoribosylformylglycinamidine cyclo-ligase
MSRYKELGVDVNKKGIESFTSIINNLFPEAFCVIQRDPDYPDTAIVNHTDSAGSKPIMAYINYRETEDTKWFRGLAQDALAMNINDLVCVGAKPLSFVDYIAFNTLLIERVELLKALTEGFSNCLNILENENCPILFSGGETADLPDLLRTLDVCVSMFGRMPMNHVISGLNIKAGDLIIGVRSGGKIRYEKEINSGIMSNGHTLARSCLINPIYVEKYPEISHPTRGRYSGRYLFDDFIDELDCTISEALLHPTRLFSPMVKKVLETTGFGVHGMVHNTGGGQTKCLRLGKNIKYLKNFLPEPDPIFRLIQSESKVGWEEMYQDFNMGIGFEFIVDPNISDEVLSIVEGYGVGVSIIGHCEKSNDLNSLIIKTNEGKFRYS